TLSDEKDQYGLPVPRITYSYCDNDKRLIQHSLGSCVARSKPSGPQRYGTKPMTRATSTARPEWVMIQKTASSMPIADLGISQICGFATVPFSLPSAE